VRFYGCAGCHEIAGLEEEQRIGTELTKEGSKPVERLDFALLGHKAEDEGWYTHKGFFEHKLENPAVYDQGKEKAPQDRLKMPNFNFSKPEIDAGHHAARRIGGPSMPARYFYNPGDQRQDIIDGWWVVRKYNCMGCHRSTWARPPCSSTAAALPGSRLEGAEAAHADRRRRARQSRMADGLPEQSVAQRDRHQSRRRAAISAYAHAHLQLLGRRDAQAGALLRGALVAGRAVHPEKVEPLTDQERTMARQLFTSEGAPCLKCHDRRSETRRARHGAEFHCGQRPPEARLGEALDSGSGADESGHRHAFRPVPPDGDRWVFAGPTPASFNGYTKDHAQLLVRYMFHAGRADPLAG
jgi:hypothetical protein